jgi:hypothetical protein
VATTTDQNKIRHLLANIGGRGRDKDRKPLTKEALDADLDAVSSFFISWSVAFYPHFTINWILGACYNCQRVRQQHPVIIK